MTWGAASTIWLTDRADELVGTSDQIRSGDGEFGYRVLVPEPYTRTYTEDDFVF